MPYIPHTKEDVESMLKSMGIQSMAHLFDEIPNDLFCEDLKNIPEGMGEMAMLQLARGLADKNQNGLCFIGAGSYDHHIPAAVWEIASRGEFLTAYTPYQAEASQGILQLLYEFQTMVAELTGLDVANASMYDGASALAEAVLMAVRINKHSKSSRILVAGTLHPFYRETIETIVRTQNVEIISLDFDKDKGITPLAALSQYEGEDITGLVIAQPNFFGCLESVDELTDWAHDHHIVTIANVNPTSLALLKPPGQWGKHGVDIACGEGQPLGVPMASGGPYFGFFSTRMKHVRHMPGRLVGRSTDETGKIGYTLTLQAREQHIRRGKATSNICTNQGLLVTAASIYMSLLGTEGLEDVAKRCHLNTALLLAMLKEIDGVDIVFSSPYFHEVLIRLPHSAEVVLAELQASNIVGGYGVEKHFPNLKNCVLICATEMRTQEEMQQYKEALQAILTKYTRSL